MQPNKRAAEVLSHPFPFFFFPQPPHARKAGPGPAFGLFFFFFFALKKHKFIPPSTCEGFSSTSLSSTKSVRTLLRLYLCLLVVVYTLNVADKLTPPPPPYFIVYSFPPPPFPTRVRKGKKGSYHAPPLPSSRVLSYIKKKQSCVQDTGPASIGDWNGQAGR